MKSTKILRRSSRPKFPGQELIDSNPRISQTVTRRSLKPMKSMMREKSVRPTTSMSRALNSTSVSEKVVAKS